MSTPVRSPRRRSWLAPLLIMALIVIPIAEVWLLVQVGQAIGPVPTILILVGEAILGGWLMQREGQRAWSALNTAFASGKMPTGELADTALVLVGGVLLMLPGFITDIFGFLFLLPFTRPYARRVLGFIIARRVARMGVDVAVLRAQSDPGNIVPGEVVESGTGQDDTGLDSTGPDSTSTPDDAGPIVIRGEIEGDTRSS